MMMVVVMVTIKLTMTVISYCTDGVDGSGVDGQSDRGDDSDDNYEYDDQVEADNDDDDNYSD